MSATNPSEENVAELAAKSLDRLISELGHDEKDLSAASQAVIPEQLVRGKRALAQAISAAKNAREALNR